MVLIRASTMSRTEEVHRITENVYKSIMEQFNPCLRNFIAMAKTYEKTLSSVTFAAKGYFDALVRMGKLASESRSSKDLEEAAWDVLFQMAEVHRQIQMQLEDMLKSFHNDLLTELEKKVQLDVRYLNTALRKYQTEHKSKGESLEKCQAEIKKLRKKSQGSKHPSRYRDKETQGRDLLAQKIPVWQQASADPNKLPERVMLRPHTISDPIPGARPLPVPPELAALMGNQQMRMMGAESVHTVNGRTGLYGEDYQRWMETRAAHEKPSPQTHRHGAETFSNTLPVRRVTSIKPTSTEAETQTLPRSSSVAAGLERNRRTRVQALFSHTAGGNSTLLSFTEGDVITLLVPEARDGWHYGENDRNRMRGWFPFSYTCVIPEPDTNNLHVSLQHSRSSSAGNLLERERATHTSDDSTPTRFMTQHSRQRQHSSTAPPFSQLEHHDSRFQTSAEDKLISTV